MNANAMAANTLAANTMAKQEWRFILFYFFKKIISDLSYYLFLAFIYS